jgi:hypothetical protein
MNISPTEVMNGDPKLRPAAESFPTVSLRGARDAATADSAFDADVRTCSDKLAEMQRLIESLKEHFHNSDPCQKPLAAAAVTPLMQTINRAYEQVQNLVSHVNLQNERFPALLDAAAQLEAARRMPAARGNVDFQRQGYRGGSSSTINVSALSRKARNRTDKAETQAISLDELMRRAQVSNGAAQLGQQAVDRLARLRVLISAATAAKLLEALRLLGEDAAARRGKSKEQLVRMMLDKVSNAANHEDFGEPLRTAGDLGVAGGKLVVFQGRPGLEPIEDAPMYNVWVANRDQPPNLTSMSGACVIRFKLCETAPLVVSGGSQQ